MRRSWIVLVYLVACGDRGLDDDPGTTGAGPVLEVTEPARGTIVEEGSSVVVRGRAQRATTVTVNGRAAAVDSDGRFEVTVDAAPGIALLRTIASDGAGRSDGDTRAVMAGNLVPLDPPVEHAVTADLSAEAFGFIGGVIARVLDGVDLGDVVAAENPIVDASLTSCLAARVDVTGVDKGPAKIELVPIDGGLALAAELAGVEARIHVAYSFLCGDGEAEVTVRAERFAAAGRLVLRTTPITGGVEVEVSDTTASFDGFAIEQDVLPDAVVDLIDGPLGAALAALIAHAVEDRVPGLLGGLLGDLAQSDGFTIGGQTVHIGVWIRGFDFSPAGGKVAIDSNVYVENTGGTGLVYVSDPQPAPAFDASSQAGAFRVAVADDAANQLLASLWAAGILDQEIPVPELGALFDRVGLTFALPPVVTALPGRGGLRVVAGDVLGSFEKEGQMVAQLALAVDTILLGGVGADGRIELVVKAPTVWLDVLGGSLSQAEVEPLGSFAATQLVSIVGDLVRNVPIPAIPGATLAEAQLTTGDAQGGYLLVRGRLR